jgi:hypothetical protein
MLFTVGARSKTTKSFGFFLGRAYQHVVAGQPTFSLQSGQPPFWLLGKAWHAAFGGGAIPLLLGKTWNAAFGGGAIPFVGSPVLKVGGGGKKRHDQPESGLDPAAVVLSA